MKNPTILFFLIVLVLMALTTLLAVKVSGRILPERWRRKAAKMVVTVNALCIVGIVLSKSLLSGFSLAGPFIELMVMWFMFQLLLALFSGICGLGRVVWHKLSPRPLPFDSGRRQLCRLAICLPAVAGGMSLYGGLVESGRIEKVCHDIALANLSERLQGIRIAQLSDVHLGYFFTLAKLQEVLAAIAAEKPDVLLITGDLFDDRQHNSQAAKLIDSYVKYFPKGIYFCWGNHEYMLGQEKIASFLAQTEIQVLCSGAACLMDGAQPLYLLGSDYPIDRDRDQAEQCRESLTASLANVPPGAVKILMAHHSAFIEHAFAAGIDLTVTGHTHGGQLGILGVPVVPLFKYTRGMFRQDNLYGYVNSGAGSWCPFRLGCPAEITYFTLGSKA